MDNYACTSDSCGANRHLFGKSHNLNQCWRITTWINGREVSPKMQKFPFKEMHLKMSPAIWRPFCSDPNVLSQEVSPEKNDHWLGLWKIKPTSFYYFLYRTPGTHAANRIPWWCHKMETFSALLAFVWGIHRSWWIPLTKSSDRELWCFLCFSPWINGWVNNREAGDLRDHYAHYDVTAMRSIKGSIDQLKKISCFHLYGSMFFAAYQCLYGISK